MMSASVIPAAELPSDIINRWLLTAKENPLYRSPNLHPEVIRAIGRCNQRVYVGFQEESDGTSLFFPFQRSTLLASVAGSVPMCDYQAFIAPVGYPIVVSDLMRRWKLGTWTFESLIGRAEIISQITTLVST